MVLGAAVLLLASACSSSGTASPAATTTTGTTTTVTAESSATGANQDPSTTIADIEIKPYTSRDHVSASQRVAYDQAPPFGGNHDGLWAACNGVVYPTAVRNENMVHTLEHGAVWIAYNPDQVKGDALKALALKVTGQPYTLMSPYPGLDKPVSLQSWGHRLKLTDPADPRVDQFIKSLRQNAYTFPEPGATCDSPQFDQDNPPPFDPSPAPAGSKPVGS
jgi:uncharacterized protein DUF3105